MYSHSILVNAICGFIHAKEIILDIIFSASFKKDNSDKNSALLGNGLIVSKI